MESIGRPFYSLFTLQRGDDVNDLSTNALLRLDGSSADVRRAGNHRMAVERLVGGGLVSVNVKTGSADLAGFEGGEKRSLVNVGAAGGVDNNNAVLHLGDALSIDEGAAVNSGSVDADEVSLGKKLIHLNVGDTELLFDASIR